MSSVLRNMQRKALRKSADYEPKDVPHVDLPDGGYIVLRPTKGYARFTAKRLWAIQETARLLSGNMGAVV